MNKCNCEAGFYRCKFAECLWREANNIYHSRGYDAWIKSEALLQYQAHMKEVYDREHKSLVS